jgi:hypothetical protein
MKSAKAMVQNKNSETLVDISAKILIETDRAMRLHDGKTSRWVPKSLVENNRDGTVTMPFWLARDLGFI